MLRTTIFTTDDAAHTFADFEHNGVRYRFAKLDAAGLPPLVDGPVWVFVDWLLDECSGLEVCRRLRRDNRFTQAKITMVLEADDLENRRRALQAGADDYAVGPLDRKTLLDRVLADQVEFVAANATHGISAGDFSINPVGQQARWRGKLIPLRPNEFRLLRVMIENANRVLTRQELIDALGKGGDPNYLRAVDVWVKRLRSGLRSVGASHLLRTVRDWGYVLDLP